MINKKYSIDKLVDVGLTNENGHDIFINRIMFPIYDLSGNPVAFSGRIYNTKDTAKYVNTKETDKFKKGKILYNYHIAKEHLKKNDSVIIMEGQMDVIRASTVGIDNCIATMGTALTRNIKVLLEIWLIMLFYVLMVMLLVKRLLLVLLSYLKIPELILK